MIYKNIIFSVTNSCADVSVFLKTSTAWIVCFPVAAFIAVTTYSAELGAAEVCVQVRVSATLQGPIGPR